MAHYDKRRHKVFAGLSPSPIRHTHTHTHIHTRLPLADAGSSAAHHNKRGDEVFADLSPFPVRPPPPVPRLANSTSMDRLNTARAHPSGAFNCEASVIVRPGALRAACALLLCIGQQRQHGPPACLTHTHTHTHTHQACSTMRHCKYGGTVLLLCVCVMCLYVCARVHAKTCVRVCDVCCCCALANSASMSCLCAVRTHQSQRARGQPCGLCRHMHGLPKLAGFELRGASAWVHAYGMLRYSNALCLKPPVEHPLFANLLFLCLAASLSRWQGLLSRDEVQQQVWDALSTRSGDTRIVPEPKSCMGSKNGNEARASHCCTRPDLCLTARVLCTPSLQRCKARTSACFCQCRWDVVSALAQRAKHA
eukprot:1157503-Pelagomonas_calceolata.AAC.2